MRVVGFLPATVHTPSTIPPREAHRHQRTLWCFATAALHALARPAGHARRTQDTRNAGAGPCVVCRRRDVQASALTAIALVDLEERAPFLAALRAEKACCAAGCQGRRLGAPPPKSRATSSGGAPANGSASSPAHSAILQLQTLSWDSTVTYHAMQAYGCVPIAGNTADVCSSTAWQQAAGAHETCQRRRAARWAAGPAAAATSAWLPCTCTQHSK